MEENVKILEELLQKEKCDIGYYMAYIFNEKEKQAIQNLIARYKETKQELESVKEIYYTQKEIETNYIPVAKAKKVILDIEQALSFARTGRYRRDKIQCQILENVRDKLHKEFFED